MAGHPRSPRTRPGRPGTRRRYRVAEAYEALHAARARGRNSADEPAAPERRPGRPTPKQARTRGVNLSSSVAAQQLHNMVMFALGHWRTLAPAKRHVRFT